MRAVGLFVLENIFGDLISTITGGTRNAVDKMAIKRAFMECGDVIGQFENTGEDSFGEAIQLAFSKTNLQTIYKKLKMESGYDYSTFIHKQMEVICSEYGIEGDAFINSFIEMFRNCIYEYDKGLHSEMYQGDWRAENHKDYLMIASKIDNLTEKLIIQQQGGTLPLLSDANTSQEKADEEGDLLNWELKYLHIDSLRGGADERKVELLKLTKHWKEERIKAPSWYIVPANKRSILKSYTRDESLLYSTKNVSLEELFDFIYELVWRHETGFIAYSMKLLSEIRKIWDQIEYEIIDSERKSHWFYIGQVLLREYREDLDIDNWNVVYRLLWEKRDIITNGEAELFLQKVKLLFMQMKITETRDRLITVQCDESAFGVRLQIAGLKAECGLLVEASQDLQNLEVDLLTKLQTDSRQQNHVLYKSILAGDYFLHSFVLQAMKPFGPNDELKNIWKKMQDCERYFNFDQEKHSFVLELHRSLKKKVKAEPFEINRENQTIVFCGDEFSETYDFYRLLDRMAMPLHLGYTRLLDDDEADFIKILIERYRYIGWYMLLRFGNTKTTEKTLSRREFIILNTDGGQGIKRAFDYVYSSVEGNIGSIQELNRQDIGNAYSHLLSNGLEILRRFASVINTTRQKKMIGLMCRLIDTDVVKEYRVLDKWIRQIMNVTDERVKASTLNELLSCSAKERTHIKGESTLDPFDVFFALVQAKHLYQSADIDPDIVDYMLERAASSEEERKSFIPRLGQMAEWGILTTEQSEKFAILLWCEVDEEKLLPYQKDYYPDVFLRWPHPEQIDVTERIKGKLLDSKNFEKIKEKQLSAITFGDSTFLDEIRNLNRNVPAFWELDEIELLMEGFLDCWQDIRKKYESEKHPDFYKEEFLSRTEALLHVISSFDRKQVQQISELVLRDMRKMIDEINQYNIQTIELTAMVTPDAELCQVVKIVIEGLKSANKKEVDASAWAVETLLHNGYMIPAVQSILDEMLSLCRYRKEPGLANCLNAIHNLLYSVPDMELSRDNLAILNEILDNIDEQTNYADNVESSEKAIKNIIYVRLCCANLAYQLYLYEQRHQMEHSLSVLNWKEICRGKRSGQEFAEVKRRWLE